MPCISKDQELLSLVIFGSALLALLSKASA